MDTAQALPQTADEMFERGKAELEAGRVDNALVCFAGLLNRNFTSPELLYLCADCFIRRGMNGIAINLLGVALQTRPDFQPGWNNLGVAFRHENYHDLARAAWEKTLALEETVEVLSNMATLSADMGDPDDAIHWCNRAIAVDPQHWQSHWNKALAHLTKREWGVGWDLYEYRKRLAHFDGRAKIDAPQWDGKKVGHLYLHGEQGVGDEVMFTSILPEIIPLCDQITVEAHKKYAGLLRQSFPGIAVVTEEAEAVGTHFDAKSGMGTLGSLFRRSREDFPGTPYLTPDPALVEHYRQELHKLGPGPYVALAWVGGTKKTRVEDRSVPLAYFRPVMNRYTCVGAQYTIHAKEEIETERVNCGLPKIDDASAGDDMHAQAALFKACDAVVTVCQTAVHVAGAVGTPTFVLVPSKPSWRYGVQGNDLPWYDSVRLFRQGPAETWLQVISRADVALRSHFLQREAA